MSSHDTPTKRRPPAPRSARGPRLTVVAAGTVVASVTFLAGCTAAKSTATPPSSALASGAVSSGASAPASSAAASSGLSSPTPFASSSPALASPVSSAVAGAPPVANIEAPATKSGFQIRVHRGSILKVDVPQAAAGTPITFTLVPASAQFITPIAGFNGYYNAASDGVVNVSVSQGGPSLGTLSVTVWG
ncbi:MAG TPA: hypothetical protein VFG00_13315 [Acidothermaceae bacterium]|nr:hypothetical protein [Acidothermaceae bacterium]